MSDSNRFPIETVERLPGQGQVGLVLVLAGEIPAALYSEVFEGHASTRYLLEGEVGSRADRLYLDFGLLHQVTGNPFCMEDRKNIFVSGDEEAAKRYGGWADLRIALFGDQDVLARYMDARSRGDFRAVDRLLGVPESSLQYRDRRGYGQALESLKDGVAIPESAAFVPFDLTIANGNLVEDELRLAERWETLVREVSPAVAEAAVAAFNSTRQKDMAEQQTTDGSKLYRSILVLDPSIEREHYGETIWIDTQSGQYEIGDGVPAAERLIKRVEATDGRNFFSRKIGQLNRA